jgi:hypothetical protein
MKSRRQVRGCHQRCDAFGPCSAEANRQQSGNPRRTLEIDCAGAALPREGHTAGQRPAVDNPLTARQTVPLDSINSEEMPGKKQSLRAYMGDRATDGSECENIAEREKMSIALQELQGEIKKGLSWMESPFFVVGAEGFEPPTLCL